MFVYGPTFESRQKVLIRLNFETSEDADWVIRVLVIVNAPWPWEFEHPPADIVLLNREFSRSGELLDQKVLIKDNIPWSMNGWWAGDFHHSLRRRQVDRVFKQQVAVAIGGVWQEDPWQGGLHNFNFSW